MSKVEINGKTKIYGVIGHPITHTLSPFLHNAVFRERGVDAVYIPFQVKADELAGAIEGMKSMEIQGLNITLPHKEQAAFYTDSIPKQIDKAIGAINTMVLSEGRILGFNTDAPGFKDDLSDQLSFEGKDKRVLVLGAGGAARAVAFELLEDGVEQLYIYNRTPERAHGLSDYLRGFFPDSEIHTLDSVTDLEGTIDLVVNSTSCGMKKNDPFPISPDVLEKVSHVYDLVYTPQETKLIAEARKQKIPASNGLGMLIHQACVSHRLWFPEVPKKEIYEIMNKAYTAHHG